MNIFISWSGDISLEVAIALKEWLREMIQNLEPWVSDRDIEAGSRWNVEVAEKLNNTEFGILCLTKENLSSEWILFEAGALAKTIANSHVVPYLIDIDFADIPKGPLTQFQGKLANKKGTFDLIKTINRVAKDRGIDEIRLNKNFTRLWSDLETVLKNLPKKTNIIKPQRSLDDIAAEILEEVRKSNRMISQMGQDVEITNISRILPIDDDNTLGGRIKNELFNQKKMMLGAFLKQAHRVFLEDKTLYILYSGEGERAIPLVNTNQNKRQLKEIAQIICGHTVQLVIQSENDYDNRPF